MLGLCQGWVKGLGRVINGGQSDLKSNQQLLTLNWVKKKKKKKQGISITGPK